MLPFGGPPPYCISKNFSYSFVQSGARKIACPSSSVMVPPQTARHCVLHLVFPRKMLPDTRTIEYAPIFDAEVSSPRVGLIGLAVSNLHAEVFSGVPEKTLDGGFGYTDDLRDLKATRPSVLGNVIQHSK